MALLLSLHHPSVDSGPGICPGPKLRAPVSSPEHASPHLHASGQILGVDMPAQDLVEAAVSGGPHSLTQSSHLTLRPQVGGGVTLPHPAFLLAGQGLRRTGF